MAQGLVSATRGAAYCPSGGRAGGLLPRWRCLCYEDSSVRPPPLAPRLLAPACAPRPRRRRTVRPGRRSGDFRRRTGTPGDNGQPRLSWRRLREPDPRHQRYVSSARPSREPRERTGGPLCRLPRTCTRRSVVGRTSGPRPIGLHRATVPGLQVGANGSRCGQGCTDRPQTGARADERVRRAHSCPSPERVLDRAEEEAQFAGDFVGRLHGAGVAWSGQHDKLGPWNCAMD